MAVKNYESERVRIIAAAFVNTGLADGTFVSIKEPGEGITDVEGADGEIARSIRSLRRAEVAITLMQTSKTNDFYSAAYHADITSHGAGTFPLLVQDLNGSTVLEAAEAWVTKIPDTDFDKTSGQTRTWIIRTGKASSFISGGN